MKNVKMLIRRITAAFLAVIMILPMLYIEPVFAADTDSSMSINLEWEDSEFKDGSAYNLVEYTNTSNNVRLKVSYSCDKINSEGYAPGDLIITVKGIGAVNRSGAIEALVGADKSGASTKTRDWSYTWNKASDTYTLTNNEAIKPNSVLSGYFELVWSIGARASINGYSQDGIKATMYLPDGSSLNSEELSFTNETKTDSFGVSISRATMYSYEGLTANIENPDDYAFVRYNLGASETLQSRGLSSYKYIFDPDAYDVGSGAIVISPNLSCSAVGDGTYKVGLSTYSSNYIYVVYPRSEYEEKTVTAGVAKLGTFYEGDDAGDTSELLLAEAYADVEIIKDFGFSDMPGDAYSFRKTTYTSRIIGSKMVSGTTETFYLTSQYYYPIEPNCSLELVDDFLYILKNNGEYRQLEPGEYEFHSITIPAASSIRNVNNIAIAANKYPVTVYAFTNGETVDTADESKIVSTRLITGSSQTVALPANTTGVAVLLGPLGESIQSLSIPVSVKFHTNDTSGLDETEQDNLLTGQVVNTAFVRVYDSAGNWINSGFTEANYDDPMGLGLAQKDMDSYGSYLDRERAAIAFYQPVADYSAYTDIGAIQNTGNRFTTTFTMGANFSFQENDYPNKFSLYTILPAEISLNGYTTPEDIWDLMKLSGLSLASAELASACTPEVLTNYQNSGRTYIALHFDFGDQQISQSSSIKATFPVKVNPDYFKKTSSSISVRSCVIIDSGVTASGKSKDTGSWGDNAALFSDINRNGKTTEQLASGYDYTSYIYADSSQFAVTKYVETSYSDGKQIATDTPPYEEYGGSYRYYLSVKNGNNTANDIVVYDFLETGKNAEWHGALASVDLSEAEALGLTGTVYYSDSTEPGALDSGNWSTVKSGNTRAVAVDFGASVLKEGQEFSVIVNMTAPTDSSLKGKITENGFTASITMHDLSSGNVTKQDNLESNLVQLSLTPPLKTLVVTKTDAEDGTPLSDAAFALVDPATNEVIATATSSTRGYAIFHDVPGGGMTYILRETTAPEGYLAAEDREISVGTDNLNISVPNERKTGAIKVYKTNSLDKTLPVEGAEYALYDGKGNLVTTAATGADGVAVFDNLPWDNYSIQETVSPDGYSLNETVYTASVGQYTVNEPVVVNAVDVQDEVLVQLHKYEMSVDGVPIDAPLAGATFELVRITAVQEKRIGLYVTDADGLIMLSELPYGQYEFREYRTPKGYYKAENTAFTLSPESKEISVDVYNQRQPGSVIISKKDNLGNIVEGIEFSLYDETMETVIDVRSTDAYGTAQFDNLEWGTYYLIETNAPDYYELDTVPKEIIIDADNLQQVVGYVNETGKGAVVLTKTDETGNNVLSGAEYCLYNTDGELLGKYVTDSSGQIFVSDIEWGSYYFKESSPPNGYTLSDEMVRFSVNAMNAKLTQELTVRDVKDSKSITVTKRIRVDDINFDNGYPTFIFKLTGTDINGEEHTYHQLVTFTEGYVENNTGLDGYVSQSVTFANLTAGLYSATEVDASRYVLTEITADENAVLDGEAVLLDVTNAEHAAATFINLNYERQDYSDCQNLMNVVKQAAQYTALKAKYASKTVEAESSIDTNLLTVTAVYDDGTAKELTPDECELSILKFPNVNGDYTVYVTYTEKGVSRTASFTVSLYGMKSRIVSLEATLKESAHIYTNKAITEDLFEVIAVYNDGTRKTLSLPTEESTYYESGDSVTVTSPNWPNNYDNNMTEAANYWEQTFEGADSIQITFDSTSATESVSYDWIQIYDSTGTSVSGKLGGTSFAGQTYTVDGNYVKIAMRSDGSVVKKGFSATLTAQYAVHVPGSPGEYTVSPSISPSVSGQADITVSLNLDTIPNDGYEATTTVTVPIEEPPPIYGVSWDGTSTTEWTRTDSAVGLNATAYISGMSEGEYGSDFDDIYPWKGMTVSEDANAGTVVAIPKFYYKLVKNASGGIDLQISPEPQEGFSVSPAHMDRGDGKGERDVVYIGRYHCAASTYKSTTGVKPQAAITRSAARTSIHNLGSNIWQSDYAIRLTVEMLYLVEYANWNSQEVIGCGCGNNSSTENMGYTDSMPYHTGTMKTSRATYGVGTQYRNIEGLWDNVYDWMDGCYYNSNGMNVILNPGSFSDSTGGTLIGKPPNGYSSAFAVADSAGFPMFYPTAASGSSSTYMCDSWYFSGSYPCLYVGGGYNQYAYHGLFYVYCSSASLANSSIGARLQILP